MSKDPSSTQYKVAEYLRRRGVGQVVSLGEIEQTTGRESNQITAAICHLERHFTAVVHCGDGHYRVLAGIALYFAGPGAGHAGKNRERVVRPFQPRPKLAQALGCTEDDLLRGVR